MKRSLQEIVELVVFGLIALLLGTFLLWVFGWVFVGVGAIFKWIAWLLWSLLKFIIPIAIVAAAVYVLVRLLTNQNKTAKVAPAPPAPPAQPVTPAPAATPAAAAPVPPAPEATPTATPEPVAQEPVSTDTNSVADSSNNDSTVEEKEQAGTNTDVDTSGFKKMDDLAEELNEDDEKQS